MKRSKENVDYSRGHKDAHCGICRHYNKDGTCELVAGKISPNMWCRLFSKRSGK